MAYFVIAGKPNCTNYIHACHVGKYLQERLPNFNLQTIEKISGDWETWLESTNQNYGWHHIQSPIIYKELVSRGGRAYLIGNLSEFWEYCYDYYSLLSVIPKEELLKIAEEHLKYFEEAERLKELNKKNILKILIAGASNPMLKILLPDLCEIAELESPAGIEIRLYDQYAETHENSKFIKGLIEGFNELPLTGCKKTIMLMDTIGNGLTECDLFIIADFIKLNEASDDNDMLIKQMSIMLHYADEINAFAKRTMRVIVAGEGAVCFSANVLTESCTRIRISNIVAVTSDLGLSALNVISKETGVPVKYLGAPPVWGFIGINEFIDVESTVKYSDIYVPYARSVTLSSNTTLSKGKLKPELRFISYLINDRQKITNKIQSNREIMYGKLKRYPAYAKARAITSLIRIWYSKEERDDIISLGVISNGAYSIPNGVVFSQPAILNSDKIWVPFEKFQLTNTVNENIKNLIPPVTELLDNFGLSR